MVDVSEIHIIGIPEYVVWAQNHIVHPPFRVGTTESGIDDGIVNRQPVTGTDRQRRSNRRNLQIGCWLRLDLQAGMSIIVILIGFIHLVIGICYHKKLVLTRQITGQRNQRTVRIGLTCLQQTAMRGTANPDIVSVAKHCVTGKNDTVRPLFSAAVADTLIQHRP